MKTIITAILCLMLAACAAPIKYWNRDATNLRQTAADLNECRLAANQGGQKVFSAIELEYPCMQAKGYRLAYTPPID